MIRLFATLFCHMSDWSQQVEDNGHTVSELGTYPLLSELGAVQTSDTVSNDRNLFKSIDLIFRIAKVSHLGVFAGVKRHL